MFRFKIKESSINILIIKLKIMYEIECQDVNKLNNYQRAFIKTCKFQLIISAISKCYCYNYKLGTHSSTNHYVQMINIYNKNFFWLLFVILFVGYCFKINHCY